MDQWIARQAQLFFDQPVAILAALPQRWLALCAVLLVLSILSIVFTIVALRSSRRQKIIEIALAEMKVEIDRLQQAEERRTLVEIRSNGCFLNEMTLELVGNKPVAIDPANPEDGKIQPLRPKVNNAS